MPKGTKGFQKGHLQFNTGKTHFKSGQIGYWKGKKRTDPKYLKKISEAHKGQHSSPTTEFKKGQISPRKGKRFPQIAGKNHYAWKGGITKIYNLIRHSFKYRQWRSDVFTRDNFTCQDCNKKGGWIEAHHIKLFIGIMKENKIKTIEEAINCEELWNINNGITLCKRCHDKTKKK